MNKIVVVVDKSGSMYSLKDDVIGGFNSFLESQQKLGDDATMTVVLFNTEYEFYAEDQPLNEIPKFTNDSYVPTGGTALLDALGRAMTNILARRKDDKVLVCVITDGQENSSKEYKKEDITKMINDKKQSGWEFMFLSSDLNAISDAKDYGFSNTFAFSADAKGTSMSYSAMGTASCVFRGYSSEELN